MFLYFYYLELFSVLIVMNPVSLHSAGSCVQSLQSNCEGACDYPSGVRRPSEVVSTSTICFEHARSFIAMEEEVSTRPYKVPLPLVLTGPGLSAYKR